MEVRIPKPGEIYKHFKGNLYEIIIIARDSETLEEKVVYKEVNGEAAYVRSLPMFVSPVDKVKYPDVIQEMRFEFVGLQKDSQCACTGSAGVDKSDSIPDEELVIGYFNQDAISDKIDYMIRVQDSVTDNFLQVVAQSLDFVENEGELQERYDALLQYLNMRARFEGGRLR